MTTLTTSARNTQDLGKGVIGQALLAVERARLEQAPWDEAHALLTACTTDLLADGRAALFYGAPAVAFVLNAAEGGSGRYRRALDRLDGAVSALARDRLDLAHRRIDAGQYARASEFDLLYGLTGLGVQMFVRGNDPERLREILAYLVRLTLPRPDGLPGWWTDLDPSGRTSEAFAGGHGNAGMAHGICGPLALLSLATLNGVTVDGQRDAIRRICSWLDTLTCFGPDGAWWPEWITLHGRRTGESARTVPTRPSWCYGLPGQVRAQQLAALALADHDLQLAVEDALLSGMTSPTTLGLLTEAGLCHGVAGALLTIRRVAEDADPGRFDQVLTRLRSNLDELPPGRPAGFLQGPEGVELVRLAELNRGVSVSSWDACLLANRQGVR